jgi:hypothetical protein
MAPWRKAAGMARNTIQIRLKRISTSVHSAGCSSTKRMMIWNMPSARGHGQHGAGRQHGSVLVHRAQR